MMTRGLVSSIVRSVASSVATGVVGGGTAAVDPGTERIQDVGFDTGTGWTGTGTVNTGAGTGTMTVAQTLIATFSSALIIGESYTLTIGVTSGSVTGTSLEGTLGVTPQTVITGGLPPSPIVFVAANASATLTLQTFDAGTLVLNSVSLIGP